MNGEKEKADQRRNGDEKPRSEENLILSSPKWTNTNASRASGKRQQAEQQQQWASERKEIYGGKKKKKKCWRRGKKAYALLSAEWNGNMIGGKKVIKQLTSIEYSLVFSRPYDGQVHVLSLESGVHDKQAGVVIY